MSSPSKAQGNYGNDVINPLKLRAIMATTSSPPKAQGNYGNDIINPLKLCVVFNQLPEDKVRRRRSLQEEEEVNETKEEESVTPLAALYLQGQKKKFYTLDCAHGAKCVTFVCPLTNINNSATLTLQSRLWNSTMIEDFNDATMVLVQGRATLKLKTKNQSVNMESQTTEIQVLVYPEAGQQLDSGAPLWVMVVSVLAGMVLLALICLLLWKCGFFVRRGAWQEAALHQGRIMGKDEQRRQRYTDGFLIEEEAESTNRKRKKHWVTTWTEAS
ncbi:integrin alpha-3-like [Sphaeramia orbicularis]|uniref:integrin alpha-3-like n=1 Tax=Sphaeramia orbicularis TaxID=375764 RepID=UPI00117CFA7E|nr:integrin alpha-3-like [Sphaeramia orbicularis]